MFVWCVHTHACVCMWRPEEEVADALLLPACSSEAGSLAEPGACIYFTEWQPLNSGDLPISVPGPHLGVTGCTDKKPGLVHECWDLNSALQGYVASTFNHGNASPTPKYAFLCYHSPS